MHFIKEEMRIKHNRKMQLFLASGLIVFVTIDVLGLFLLTSNGKQQLVIYPTASPNIDLQYPRTRLQWITSQQPLLTANKTLCGKLVYVSSENGSSLWASSSKLFLILLTRQISNANYHPNPNRTLESSSVVLVTRVFHNFAEPQKHCSYMLQNSGSQSEAKRTWR